MIKRPLTPKQQQVLSAIESYAEAHHDFPSMRSLSETMGLASPNAAFQYMKALERKGYIINNGGQYDFARDLYFMSRPRQGELKKLIDKLLADYEKALVKAGVPRDDASRRRQTRRAEICRLLPSA
jgi:SOS-response transcriptional repressor LexA